jgi:hypothetical protein
LASPSAATLTASSPDGWLDRARTVAKPGFNRWLVPPAALAIHLCIGMAYGFSVFWLPLAQSLGVSKPVACPADMSILAVLFTTSCDWRVADLGWMYTLFFVLLGSSAALWGRLARTDGPPESRICRRPMLVRRASHFGARGNLSSIVDALARLRSHWRHRPWSWLYIAGLDAG